MRQVTEDIMNAFINFQSLTKSNSYTDGQTVYLHNNAIAKRESGHIYISDAGWQTTTTKERLNGLLELLTDIRRIRQKNFVWFLGDTEFCELEDSEGWICIK